MPVRTTGMRYHRGFEQTIMKGEILIGWDLKTLNHISKHDVSEKEVEIAMNGDGDKYKVITARDATRAEKKLYIKRGK